MIEKDVLEHVLGHARRVKGPRHPLAHQKGLRGVFEHNRVPGDERGGHRVDCRHVRVVPWRHDKDHAMWHAPDIAFERGVLAYGDVRERLSGNRGHVACALVEPAELATIANRPAHHPGQFRHHLVIHGPHRGDTGHDQRGPLCQRPRTPCRLCRARPVRGGKGRRFVQRFARRKNRAVNR